MNKIGLIGGTEPEDTKGVQRDRGAHHTRGTGTSCCAGLHGATDNF